MGTRILWGYDTGGRRARPKLPRFHSPSGGGLLYYGGVPSVILYYHRRLPERGHGSGWPIGKHLRRVKLPPYHLRSRLVRHYHRRLSGPPRPHKWPAWAVGNWEGLG